MKEDQITGYPITRRPDKRRQNRSPDSKPSRIQCFGCDGYDHIKKDCPSVHKNYRSDRRQREKASRAETEEPSSKRSKRTHSTDANYLLLSALSGTIQTSSNTWLIDSGASRHMKCYQELLSDLAKRESYQNVVLGDDAIYVVRGAGATSFQLKSRKTFKMKDVLHVPGMTSNLVAMSALEDEGYDVIFSRGSLHSEVRQ